MSKRCFTVMIAGVAKPGMEEYVRGFLLELAEHSANDKGCLLYNIHQSENNPAEFMLYTVWQDRAAFYQHNKNPYLQEFRDDLAKNMFDIQSPKTFWQLLTPLNLNSK